MIFRQLFDQTSCTYTYLMASRPGGDRVRDQYQEIRTAWPLTSSAQTYSGRAR